MSIDDLGSSLLQRQGEARDERDARNRKISRENRKAARRGVAFKIAGALAGDFFGRKAATDAASFLQAEPVMAQRVKYNMGVQNSIKAIQEHEKANAHPTGALDYYTDQYLPEVQEALRRSVREEDYTKQGFETYSYNKAREFAQEMMPLHQQAYQAALRVGKDPKAFDEFIKINDGIPDTRAGAVLKGITGLFKGQSQEALAARMNSLTNSRYVLSAESMNTAAKAIQEARGQLNTGDAERIAKALEEHKATADDWVDTGISEPKFENIKVAGIDHTIRGELKTFKNSWGETSKRFVPNEKYKKIYEGREDVSVTTSEFAEVNGVEVRRSVTKVASPIDNSVVESKGKWEAVGLAQSDVSDSDSEDAVSDLYGNMIKYESVLGKVNADDLNEYIMMGTDASVRNLVFTNDFQMPDEKRKAFGRAIVSDAAKIQVGVSEAGLNIPSDVAQQLSREVVLNDIARTKEENMVLPDNLDQTKVLRRSDKYNPFLVLEAIGSLHQNDIDIDKGLSITRSIVNSEGFYTYVRGIKGTSEASQLLKTFSLYEDEEGYQHLFRPEIILKSGQAVSVMDVLRNAQ